MAVHIEVKKKALVAAKEFYNFTFSDPPQLEHQFTHPHLSSTYILNLSQDTALVQSHSLLHLEAAQHHHPTPQYHFGDLRDFFYQ